MKTAIGLSSADRPSDPRLAGIAHTDAGNFEQRLEMR
jgi:hypothetical protein